MRSLIDAVRDTSERRYYERTLEMAKSGEWQEPMRHRGGGKGHFILSPEQQAEIARLRLEDVGVQELTRRFSVSEATVRKALRRRGVVPPKRRPRRGIPQQENSACVSRILELRAQDKTAATIAAEVGVSMPTVWRVLAKHGIRKRPPAVPVPASDRERILALAEQGLSQSEIARQVGRGRSTVRLALAKSTRAQRVQGVQDGVNER